MNRKKGIMNLYGRNNMVMMLSDKIYGSLGSRTTYVTHNAKGKPPLVLHNTLQDSVVGIEMQGWTEQNRYEAKNLFDKSEIVLSGTTITYMPVNVGDGEYTLSTNYIASGRNDVFFLPGNVNTGASSLSNGVQHGTSRTVTSENGYVTVALRLSSDGTTSPLDYQIMLNEGSTALPYEPYTGGQPSPNPDYPQPITSAGKHDEETQKYQYEVKLTGAQLFDVSQLQSVSTSADGVQRNGVEITGLEPGQYTISTKTKTVGTICYLYAIVKNSSGGFGTINYIVTHVLIRPATVSIESGDTLIIFDAQTHTVEVSKALFDEYGMMVNAGSTALPYEPYRTPQTVTLTSDRPLTKWDRLEKRNGQWGWVYKSDTAVFDGSEKWSLYPGANVGTVFYIALPNASFGFQTSLCDKYRNINRIWDENYEVVFGVYSDHNAAMVKYFRPPSADVETVEQWKTWLQSNPLTLWYETAEETFVPLSESEQEQMNALHTFRPTTVLSNDQDCVMKITYKASE